MASTNEFSLIEQNTTKLPHKFIAFKHNSLLDPSLKDTVEECLKAWRINADAYKNISDTGFKSDNIVKSMPILNDIGKSRLPKTPAEDKNITKNPYITDITEILAMQLIKNQNKDLIIPYPRVLHKELRGTQHRGIDLIGYIESTNGHILMIIEIMASVEDNYPASTVKQHLKQILDDTLQENNERLINELDFIHDEADEIYKDTINGFLIAICGKKLNNKDDVIAVPVMVRPVNKWDNNDWKPFLCSTQEFENAKIPSTICYYAIECDCNFSELIDRIKTRAI